MANASLEGCGRNCASDKLCVLSLLFATPVFAHDHARADARAHHESFKKVMI